jgi:hypothetical protein
MYTKTSIVGQNDHTELFKRLTDVKNWQNNAFHNLQVFHNDSNFRDLKAALMDLIDKIGRLYSLPHGEINDKKGELENESKNLVALNHYIYHYWLL